MLIWYDADGYNIVFGEIHEDLLPDNFATETDWLDIFPVSLKQGNPDQKIIKTEFIEYKKIGDFVHYSWIVFQDKNIETLKNELTSKENSSQSEKSSSIEERLKKLQDLYNKKLITKEEYEQRKKAILEEL
ncbi:MAG: hypothetical protein KatS3mg129_1608 [Leptospiraceae bacterium]|nr:MAG: hypothetical protein KatS3mg129_1608 [Leptospiraceae bacterium]